MNVYLDNNATTKMDKSAVEAMLPFFTEIYANASSIHKAGQEAGKVLKECREKIASILNIDEIEVVFTGSGTESNNLAIRGVAKAYQKRGKHIITSAIEHPSVKATVADLEKDGYEITYIDVDKNGVLDLEKFKAALRDDTILVTIMHANNEVGTIQPIKEIGEILKDRKTIFHVDAVQSLGKIDVFPKDLNVDLMSFSGHKFYGPKGTGILYAKRGIRLGSVITGGHQERKRRPGTTDLAGIVGMTKALELTMKNEKEDAIKEAELRDYFEEKLLEKIPEIVINGKGAPRLPGTSSITFKYLEGESILLMLDYKGICVSSGSACASDDLKASHVLLAMGVPIEFAHGTIRFSLGKYNTKQEIDYVIETVPPVIDRLRTMSPLWNEFINESN